MIKYRPELTELEKNELRRLSAIDFSTYTEADVREEFIVPLLVILGYRKDLDYSVSREVTFDQNEIFLSVGSKQVRLDYLCSVRKQLFWLIDAKKGSGERDIQTEDIFQAYFYSQHPEIDTIYYAVCNGWYFNLYERDRITNLSDPIVSIESIELFDRFLELDRFIGSTQILPTLKNQLLKRTKKILAAEVFLDRLPEFTRAIQNITREIEPQVLENFRANSKIVEANRKKEHETMIRKLRPYEVLDSLFLTANTFPAIEEATILLFENEGFQTGHSNQYLLFHKLLLEELRPVTYWYYVNVTHFLFYLKKKQIVTVDYPFMSKEKGNVDEIINYWVLNIYSFFSNRRDLKMLSLLEGLYYRQLKFTLVMSKHARNLITNSVEFSNFILPEEEIAWLGPNPARELIDIVLNTTFTQLGKFIDRFYDYGQRSFRDELAKNELQTMINQFNIVYNKNETIYKEVLRELGSAWGELLGFDITYNHWNPLISCVSQFLITYPDVFAILSSEVKESIVRCNSLKFSSHTDELCKKYNLTTNDLGEQQRNEEINKFYALS